jgi:GAF domain-containing protein
VHAFPGHIPCDSRSRSEIVIPIVKGDRVVAVLDVDSNELAQFSDEDAASLERIVALLDPFC